jgi:transcriptional regulator with XRE-family HTH domain
MSADLEALGRRIRDTRKAAKLAASSVAEAAGMSRVTLSRIERGEPSVTMGAYLGVITALGLDLRLADPRSIDEVKPRAKTSTTQPDRIRIADYPQLASVAWHVPGLTELTADEARGIYERHWRYLDPASIGPAEARLLARLGLAQRLGSTLPA